MATAPRKEKNMLRKPTQSSEAKQGISLAAAVAPAVQAMLKEVREICARLEIIPDSDWEKLQARAAEERGLYAVPTEESTSPVYSSESEDKQRQNFMLLPPALRARVEALETLSLLLYSQQGEGFVALQDLVDYLEEIDDRMATLRAHAAKAARRAA